MITAREIYESTSRDTFGGGEKESSGYSNLLRYFEGKMSRGEEEVLVKIW